MLSQEQAHILREERLIERQLKRYVKTLEHIQTNRVTDIDKQILMYSVQMQINKLQIKASAIAIDVIRLKAKENGSTVKFSTSHDAF